MSKRKVYICKKCQRQCRLEFTEDLLIDSNDIICPFLWRISDWEEIIDNRVVIKTGTVGLLVNLLVNKINELNKEIAKYKTYEEVSEDV